MYLPAPLRRFNGGKEQVEVAAANVRDLIAALDERFPGIGEHLREGTAISIDGEIIQEPMLEAVLPESEVHFLPQISGG